MQVTALALLGIISAALLVEVIAAIILETLRREPLSVEPAQPCSVPNAAWAPLHAFRVRSRDDEDDAISQTFFDLEPVEWQPLPAYRAGQFPKFHFELPDAQGKDRRITRCYSLSDRYDPQAYRISVKRISPPRNRPNSLPALVSNDLQNRVVPGVIVHSRRQEVAFGGVWRTLLDKARPPVLFSR